MSDCEKGAIGLFLLVILFMGSTLYFAYWANKLQKMLIEEWDEQERKNE
jgi:hypothetical protein